MTLRRKTSVQREPSLANQTWPQANIIKKRNHPCPVTFYLPTKGGGGENKAGGGLGGPARTDGGPPQRK